MHPGDTVRITTKDHTYEGRLLPSEGKTLVLKLKSGYNVGILPEHITKKETIETGKDNKKQKIVVTPHPNLPKLSILHTGGTIASRIDYRTGGVVASFSPEDLLAMFPELAEIANFDSRLVSNMWSDDLRFASLTTLAKAIEQEIASGTEGIIVGMGTDNLAVASAALSFMIQDSPIPIILVGSQRSSDRGSSDAAMNLACAATFITKTDFAGVAICMHHTSEDTACAILPATKTYKLHSSRRDAFTAVNANPLALVEYSTREINFISDAYTKRHAREPRVRTQMEERVGLLKAHVNMFPEEILAFKGFKGLIIEGTGLGHLPIHAPNDEAKPNEAVRKALTEVIASGTIVVMTTQTIFGRVNMNVYSKGRDLMEMGVIPGEDMLANTALVKLSWLLGNYTAQEARALIQENITGEISSRTLYKEHFSK